MREYLVEAWETWDGSEGRHQYRHVYVLNRHEAEIEGLERHESENNASILAIERQRNAAMAFGGITKDEVADADVLKGQAALKARLESELEEQRKITEEIATLEKDGDPTKMIDRLKQVIPSEKIRNITERNLKAIVEGKRDFRF